MLQQDYCLIPSNESPVAKEKDVVKNTGNRRKKKKRNKKAYSEETENRLKASYKNADVHLAAACSERQHHHFITIICICMQNISDIMYYYILLVMFFGGRVRLMLPCGLGVERIRQGKYY